MIIFDPAGNQRSIIEDAIRAEELLRRMRERVSGSPTEHAKGIADAVMNKLREQGDEHAMDGNQRLLTAIDVVYQYVRAHLDSTDDIANTFEKNQVFIVWFCKTLEHWKACVSTTLPDGMYYEVTFAGDRGEIYLDAYKKFENKCLRQDPDGKWHG